MEPRIGQKTANASEQHSDFALASLEFNAHSSPVGVRTVQPPLNAARMPGDVAFNLGRCPPSALVSRPDAAKIQLGRMVSVALADLGSRLLILRSGSYRAARP